MSANICVTCGRAFGGATGGAHGCGTVAVVTNARGKTVYQTWVDPTQSKAYCWLCTKIHRNHAGVAVVCVWTQAEALANVRLAANAKSFERVEDMLSNGMIFDPLSKAGKAEIVARKVGATTITAGSQPTVAPTPVGVCSQCGNGPLSAAEQATGMCAACWAVANPASPPVPRVPTVSQAPRVPLVPGAQRRVTVGQASAGVAAPSEPTVSAPVDTGAETPQARKARILAAMKG